MMRALGATQTYHWAQKVRRLTVRAHWRVQCSGTKVSYCDLSYYFQPPYLFFSLFSVFIDASVSKAVYIFFRYTAHLYIISYDRLEYLIVYSSSHWHQGAGNKPQGGLGSEVVVLLRVLSRSHPSLWITGRVLGRPRRPILIECVAVIRA